MAVAVVHLASITGMGAVGSSFVCDVARTKAKWLLVSALLHPDGRELRGNGTNIIPDTTDSRLFLRVIYPEPENAEEKTDEKEKYVPDNELTEKIRESISFEYPYAPLLQVEAKSSVSALANKAESDKFAFSARPAFMPDYPLPLQYPSAESHVAQYP